MRLLVIFLTVIITLSAQVTSLPASGGGGPVAASSVTAGTFGDGDYAFPGSVAIRSGDTPDSTQALLIGSDTYAQIDGPLVEVEHTMTSPDTYGFIENSLKLNPSADLNFTFVSYQMDTRILGTHGSSHELNNQQNRLLLFGTGVLSGPVAVFDNIVTLNGQTVTGPLRGMWLEVGYAAGSAVDFAQIAGVDQSSFGWISGENYFIRYPDVGAVKFDVDKDGKVKAAGYLSSDGTPGFTGSCAASTTATVKNGLITGCS